MNLIEMFKELSDEEKEEFARLIMKENNTKININNFNVEELTSEILKQVNKKTTKGGNQIISF